MPFGGLDGNRRRAWSWSASPESRGAGALRVRVSPRGQPPRLQAVVSPQLSRLLTLTAKSGKGEDGSFPPKLPSLPRGEELDARAGRTKGHRGSRQVAWESLG
ncbi:unnamed protein product [Pipistrellus nathusii]|uniref:Uncharacterized protein n=1 Tax=Pipistrellus nathusii TaxID=59473 RepID=A0ABN9ZYW3_PIPNA